MWAESLSTEKDFSDPAYFNLLTGLWSAQEGVSKTEAFRLMRQPKSPHTSGKYLQRALDEGLIDERPSSADRRTKIIALSQSARRQLDDFYEVVHSELVRFAKGMR
ncbi:MAG: hypothetical protein GKR94_28705 [Gammaproteobacteria bacterium]|nr:hypothetical protein [Gammaproteobacteria bacterium]